MIKITFTCFVLFYVTFLGFDNEEPMPVKVSYFEGLEHILSVN